jgi:hypothetical protein
VNDKRKAGFGLLFTGIFVGCMSFISFPAIFGGVCIGIIIPIALIVIITEK